MSQTRESGRLAGLVAPEDLTGEVLASPSPLQAAACAITEESEAAYG